MSLNIYSENNNIDSTNTDTLNIPKPKFPYEAYTEAKNIFFTNFENWIEKKKVGIEEGKQLHLKAALEDRAQKTQILKQMEIYEKKEMEYSKNIEIERNEAENLANQLSEKKKLKINLLSKRDELILMKKELEKKLSKKKEELSYKRMEKEEQIKKNIPELNFYENTLAMKITVLKENILEFGFTNINKEIVSKKYSFVIDVSNKNYKVFIYKNNLLTKNVIRYYIYD
ncbi:hypothetical protein H8356DRAFT_1282848 [Neocallimastix lanati (nom. inval.)]|uniref:Kinetochore protein SPC25 n=1 Tax=Neocallimastix californiae TaxID=1754190 RepID=A0A1Y2DRH2_9FUNG|nr:hypothetical protein H8356DRAFT_1282848 [Neocallimastix sp. JGI-2020a]ORY61878.1 hypothetical protein LY90DRAFT_668519 [Neocallimastix californiae]|eukprot:ORY61878.1 hypothetical protein LY90DRAFT_668519 [Neocallimastix californiae]